MTCAVDLIAEFLRELRVFPAEPTLDKRIALYRLKARAFDAIVTEVAADGDRLRSDEASTACATALAEVRELELLLHGSPRSFETEGIPQ